MFRVISMRDVSLKPRSTPFNVDAGNRKVVAARQATFYRQITLSTQQRFFANHSLKQNQSICKGIQ
jgi:hypothetical protein